MWLVQAALVIGGLVVLGLAYHALQFALRGLRDWLDHRGTMPAHPLLEASVPGQHVHVVGALVTPDQAESPVGARPSAYLDVELAQVSDGGRPIRTFLKETHGDTLSIDDGSAVGVVRMADADVVDRQPFERVWAPRARPPLLVLEALAARDRAPQRPPVSAGGPDLRYRELALRQGEPTRVHGVVLEVQPAPPGGRPTVILGASPRVRLRVSNMTDADLVELRLRAARSGGLGAVLVLLGLAMTLAGAYWAVQTHRSDASAASSTTVAPR